VNVDPASIEFEDGNPLYRRAFRVLAEQIVSGALQPGDRLPPERSISEKLGVSRVTVRRALRELSEKGLLVQSGGGRGYEVSPARVSEPPNALVSFSAMARERGLSVSSHVLAAALRPATIDEAEGLRIAPGSVVFELVRIRHLDGVPIAVDESCISHARVPGIEDVDFSTASLYETLASRWRIVPTRADYVIEAVAAGELDAERLDLEPHAPLLVARETVYDQYDAPVDIGCITYRGDRYRFQATLMRHPA